MIPVLNQFKNETKKSLELYQKNMLILQYFENLETIMNLMKSTNQKKKYIEQNKGINDKEKNNNKRRKYKIIYYLFLNLGMNIIKTLHQKFLIETKKKRKI